MHCKFLAFLGENCSALHFLLFHYLEKMMSYEVIFLPADTRFFLSRSNNFSLPRKEFLPAEAGIFPSRRKKEGKVCENFIFSITFVVQSMNDGMSHEPNE